MQSRRSWRIGSRLARGLFTGISPASGELFLAATDRVMRRLQDEINAQVAGITDGLERVERGVATFLKFFADHPSFVELLIQERAYFKDRKRPTYFEHREVNIEPWRRLYSAMIDQGRIRDIPVEQITDVVSNVLYGIMVTNFFNGETKSPDVQAKEILEVIFQGILTPDERDSPGEPTTGCRARLGADPGIVYETSSEDGNLMNRRARILLTVPLLASAAATGCQQAKSGPVKTSPTAVYDLPVTRTVTDYEEFPGDIDTPYSVQVTAASLGLPE